MRYALSVWYQCVARLETSCRPLILWQLKLLAAFYDRVASSSLSTDSRLLSREFLLSLQTRIETVLNQWVKSTTSQISNFYRVVLYCTDSSGNESLHRHIFSMTTQMCLVHSVGGWS